MKRPRKTAAYAACVSNAGYRASLVVRKIYQVLPDAEAEEHSLLRVVDESGEDYLYPEKLFAVIELPPAAKRMFALAT